MKSFELATLPGPLRWINEPVGWKLMPDGSLVIDAGQETDWFADPALDTIKDDAPAALFTTFDRDFTLSAKTTVAFAATFDAGVIQIRASYSHWGKLCFEYSPQGRPMIVSVVTRGRSDDCNSVVIQGNEVFLRAARLGDTFAFHYSEDGRAWHMVRYFTLGTVTALQAGFSSQSPTGKGCRSTFSQVVYTSQRLNDIRSGQ